jgi:hypothetical protein
MVAACLTAVFTLNGRAQRTSIDGAAIHVESNPQVLEMCGTGVEISRDGRFGRRTVFPDQFPMAFDQNPAILTPDYRGTIALRNLRVTGDVASLRFNLHGGDGLASQIETWTRTATEQIGGRMVSVFNPSWSALTLSRTMQRTGWGWDTPSLYWGEVLPQGVEPGNGFSIRLRIASGELPHVPVAQLAADVQYSSHIVNLTVKEFGDTRVNGDEYRFDLASVTRKFYEYFEDSYDAIAVVPADMELASYNAYHQNVQNDVRGIGVSLFDNSPQYGSASHKLHAIEVFTQGNFGTNRSSAHEAAHQWGSYFNWTALTGVPVIDTVHDPLFAGNETRLGAILEGTRRVRGNSDRWEIENTPAPILFHPLTLYGMGLLRKEDVPEILLFQQQDLFKGNRSPVAGTVVSSETRSATVYNIIGMLGERSGPTPSEWRRATVVVSRDGLLSQREMGYWTFLAQRIEDPNSSGLVSYEGYGSFDVATRRGIDLQQDIRPKATQRIEPLRQVDFPAFGPSDIRDVRFDAPISTNYKVGQRVRWSGAVAASDNRNDFNWILFRLWKYGGASEDAVSVWVPVSTAHSFSTEFEIEARHRGRYQLEVYLFWPGSGAQHPRAILTPFIVD